MLSLIETNYLSFIVFKDYAVVFVFAVALSKLILVIVVLINGNCTHSLRLRLLSVYLLATLSRDEIPEK